MQKVRLILTSGLLLLLLAACDGGTAAPVDMYEAEAVVKRAKAQTAEAVQATHQANDLATREAAKAKDAAEYEMALIDKQLDAEWQKVYAQETRAAIDGATATIESAKATEHAAAIGTATAWPMTAVPLQATQAAIAASSQYTEARANMAVVGDVIKFVAALAIMGWTIVKVVTSLTNRYRTANTVYGVVAFDPNVTMLAANTSQPPPVTNVKFREIPDVISLNRSGTVLASAPMSEEERTRRNLINYLKTMDQNATQLARWSSIPGMTSEKWQHYVNILKQMGYVEVSPHRGTYVRGGVVGSIVYDLETNVEISDLSPAD